MNKSLTIEEAKNNIFKINPDIEITTDIYVNAHTKLECRCRVCGMIWETTYSNLRSSKKHEGCKFCNSKNTGKNRSFTLEEVRRKIKENNPTVEIMSDTYVDSTKKLKCRCKICGRIFYSSFNVLNKGHSCAKCKGSLRLTLEEVVEIVNKTSPTIQILSNEYKNAHTKLSCRCKVCGYEFKAVYNNLRTGTKCAKCNNTAKMSFSEVKNFVFENHPTIEIISKEYNGIRGELYCRCKIDNLEWKTTFHSLKTMHGCPRCDGREKMTIEVARIKLSKISPNIQILTNNYQNNTQKLKCKCKICENIWETSWQCLYNLSTGCPSCSAKRNSGKDSYLWKGGISPLTHYLRGSITQWKEDSKKACGYKCAVSGEKFDDVHHLYGFNLIVQEALLMENLPIYEKIGDYTESELSRLNEKTIALHSQYGLGICLKREIHDQFHIQFKKGDNTPEQFEEFLKINKLHRRL